MQGNDITLLFLANHTQDRAVKTIFPNNALLPDGDHKQSPSYLAPHQLNVSEHSLSMAETLCPYVKFESIRVA